MFARWCRLPVSPLGCRSVHKINVALEPLQPELSEVWQRDAIQACMNTIQAGRTKIGIQLAKGTYSTLGGLMDSLRQNLHLDASRRQILVITDTAVSAKKFAHKISLQRPHLRIEVDDKTATTQSDAEILVTTYKIVQKDVKKQGKLMNQKTIVLPKRFDKSALKAVILHNVDEFKPPSYDPFLARFETELPEDAPSAPQQPVIIGTSSSDDFNALRRLKFIEEVAYRRSFLDDFQETWECNALFSAIPAPIGLRKISIKQQSFFQVHSLSKVMRQTPLLRITVQAWLERAATRKSTLVYCANDNHAQKLAAAFIEIAKVDARSIPLKAVLAQPKTPEYSLYTQEMAAFEAGEFPVLLYPHPVAIDLPRIDCVLIAAPAVDREVLANMMSSGMKPSPDTLKEDAVIIEIVDINQKRTHGYSLSKLFLLEPENIDGQPADVLRRRAEEKAQEVLDKLNSEPEPETEPTPHLDVEQLPASGALARQANAGLSDPALKIMNKTHKRRWVRCAPGIYVHDCFGGGHAIVRAVKTAEGDLAYEAYWTTRRLIEGTSTDKESTRKLSVPGELENILHQVSAFFAKHELSRSVSRSIEATGRQIEALRALCPETMSHVVHDGQPMSRDAFLDWVTYGDASNALARLRYSRDPDTPAFTYAEQGAIVKRIRANEQVSGLVYVIPSLGSEQAYIFPRSPEQGSKEKKFNVKRSASKDWRNWKRKGWPQNSRRRGKRPKKRGNWRLQDRSRHGWSSR
ncbi:hypothetical protein B0H19DRAFT_1095205 [Mycena capillaripes]|nr:hypothetical protein B0H19DRAFT_1095205 [Mycena capillaripes]